MTREEIEKEIMLMTEWEGSDAKHPVMRYDWNHDGIGCDHDDGYLCEHRARYILNLIDKYDK